MTRIGIVRVEPGRSQRGNYSTGVQIIFKQNHREEEQFLRDFLDEQRNYKTEEAYPLPDTPFMCLSLYQDGQHGKKLSALAEMPRLGLARKRLALRSSPFLQTSWNT